MRAQGAGQVGSGLGAAQPDVHPAHPRTPHAFARRTIWSHNVAHRRHCNQESGPTIMPTDKRSLWLWTAASFFAFFIFGFADNLKGPALPALLADLHLSYSAGGTLLFAAYVGFLLATLVTGLLADLMGRKAVLLVASAALLAGAAGFSASGRGGVTLPLQYVQLVVTMALLGFGLGAIELGGNTAIVDLHAANRGRYLNLLSVFHGLGATVAPYLGGRLLAAGYSWRASYRWCLVPVAILAVTLLLLHYPQPRPTKSERGGLAGLGRAAFTRRMAWFYLYVAAYVAAEIGLASWIVNYLQQVKGQSVVLSSTYLSLFFAGIMLGRLAGSFLVERLGYLRSLLLSTLAATVCLGIGILGPAALSFCLPLTGLFFSILFPTNTAIVSALHRENQAAILGLLFTFAGVGGMLGPWLIGLLNDLLGLQLGFASLLGMCGVMVVAACALQNTEKALAIWNSPAS
jgi:MFS transporter, FHS family, glucose/mannose:H+ symporter